ncbi:MAG: NYN domain-containing protein [Planctomycetota bacterium]|nr:NYN domain-containing protein [Planctomycetota bacterium]
MDRSPELAPLRVDPVPGAVLVDFENLVYGLAHHHGAEQLVEAACLPTLCALLRELAHPGVRRAYGDWRVRDLNQFQVELYRNGFEIVQVLGRLAQGARKNASDIRLAVDAVELALREPHLRRFVIVSGDRDMIEVVRCLQKHGREVFVIAADWSASADLSDVCDRFLPYSEVQRRAGLVLNARPTVADRAFGELRAVLRDLLATERDAPWCGTELKRELLARHGERFAEEDYGAPSFQRLLEKMPDIARIEPRLAGDILVHPVAPVGAEEVSLSARGTGIRAVLPGQSQLVARARLANYRYEGDPERRRRILRAIHDAARARPDFSLAEVRTAMSAPDSGVGMRPGDVNKCWTVLYQGRAFRQTTHDAITPMQFRRHALAPEVTDAEQVVRIYERCIVYKLLENSRGEPTAQEVRVLLGLQEEDLGWCAGLLDEARRLLLAT